METTHQLERKITEKVDLSLAEPISFNGKCDIFYATIVNCI
ncbi:Vacuolar protein sorting-associated protein 53 [Tyrophagus putrescentiae]|nr:Vacuolar protein sorting-associated protein 53 [Tyrophagus putrescentiae]